MAPSFSRFKPSTTRKLTLPRGDDLASARLLQPNNYKDDDSDNEKLSFISDSDKATLRSPMNPMDSPVPFSRWTAWSQVLAGHLVIFNTFGYIGSWGLFQSHYQEQLGASSSAISWVGSIQLFLVFFIGTFSGRALDAGYLRTTVATGCALQVIGIFTTSIAKSYAALFICQGILVGVGDGLVFTPMISLISTYYNNKNRALAVSFAAAGAATGGMVFPTIARFMLDSVGVGWTVRVMGFVFLATSTVAVALLRVSVKPRKTGPLVEWEAFKEMPYLLFCVGCFLALWGLYFAYYYVCAHSSPFDTNIN
jgi:MFS family permease